MNLWFISVFWLVFKTLQFRISTWTSTLTSVFVAACSLRTKLGLITITTTTTTTIPPLLLLLLPLLLLQLLLLLPPLVLLLLPLLLLLVVLLLPLLLLLLLVLLLLPLHHCYYYYYYYYYSKVLVEWVATAAYCSGFPVSNLSYAIADLCFKYFSWLA